MESIIILVVGILFILAISDLVVGVANDAVNFLNSAIGSKSAPFWVIMAVASAGVLVGATFSTGMMEVARNGIFNPQYFYFQEILIIFLAVMLTDVILLDMFNTFGLPTSTTVSLVFELLGAAVAISIMKIVNDPDAGNISQYINSAKVLAIISGILISVVISIAFGTLIMYIVRYFFTFDLVKGSKYFGAMWGGLAIALITYFIFIKGIKGSAFAEYELDSGITMQQFINENTWLLLLYSFIGWSILFQLIMLITKFNVLKIVVLIGTFALAMAFAGNDLVNFIGVPMAGYSAYLDFSTSGIADPNHYLMTSMAGKVPTPLLFLILAGLIMVATLWLSRKAKSVTQTELDLSSQDVQEERFGSSRLARTIVRSSIAMNNSISRFMPDRLINHLDKRFNTTSYTGLTLDGSEKVSFDLVRASVNLTVASALIAFGTSLKLPLSTTYVTFMVAMGTSLADKAWGRESAVYRITGVIAVIGGWFLTAIIAFTVSMLIALFLYWGELYAVAAMIAIAVIILFRTHALHKKRFDARTDKDLLPITDVVRDEDIIASCTQTITENLNDFIQVYENVIVGLRTENRKLLADVDFKVKELNNTAKKLKSRIFITLKQLEEKAVESGPYYVQILDYLREMAHSLTFIAKPAFDHVNNNHKSLSESQLANLEKINDQLTNMFGEMLHIIEIQNYDSLPEIYERQEALLKLIRKLRKEQIKSLKANTEASTKSSILYFNTLYETQNFLLHSINLLKSQRDFSQELRK
jgi:phosphate/sulfate permease